MKILKICSIKKPFQLLFMKNQVFIETKKELVINERAESSFFKKTAGDVKNIETFIFTRT